MIFKKLVLLFAIFFGTECSAKLPKVMGDCISRAEAADIEVQRHIGASQLGNALPRDLKILESIKVGDCPNQYRVAVEELYSAISAFNTMLEKTATIGDKFSMQFGKLGGGIPNWSRSVEVNRLMGNMRVAMLEEGYQRRRYVALRDDKSEIDNLNARFNCAHINLGKIFALNNEYAEDMTIKKLQSLYLGISSIKPYNCGEKLRIAIVEYINATELYFFYVSAAGNLSNVAIASVRGFLSPMGVISTMNDIEKTEREVLLRFQAASVGLRKASSEYLDIVTQLPR